MTVFQKLNKPRNDATLNDAFDWGIFLFRKKFTKLGGRVQLPLWILRKDAGDHLIGQLNRDSVSHMNKF